MVTVSRAVSTVLLGCIVALGGSMAGCTGTDSPEIESTGAVDVTNIDGYAPAGDPKSAIEYTGNQLIFTAEVLRHLAPRKVNAKAPSGDAIKYIYTPVEVRVENPVKGTSVKAGDVVIIRAIGGQIGNERTDYKIGPVPGQYKQGQKFVFFTGVGADAGDGVTAITPNFVFAFESGNVFNLHEPEHKTSETLFFASHNEWVAYQK